MANRSSEVVTINGLDTDRILPALLGCNQVMCSSGYEDEGDWEGDRAQEEEKRLKCLAEYQILDTAPEPLFTRATTLGSR
jgi:hypothetical protein